MMLHGAAHPPWSDRRAPATPRPRAARTTPLAAWLRRADATQPDDVEVKLADPCGYVTRTLTVPGVTPPPQVVLEVIDSFRIAGRGVVLQLRSPALSRDTDPPWQLRIVATTDVGPSAGASSPVQLTRRSPPLTASGHPARSWNPYL